MCEGILPNLLVVIIVVFDKKFYNNCMFTNCRLSGEFVDGICLLLICFPIVRLAQTFHLKSVVPQSIDTGRVARGSPKVSTATISHFMSETAVSRKWLFDI